MLNKLKDERENLMVSKAELARRAGISIQTIARIEKGNKCRLETKRKILDALGLPCDDKEKVFPEG